VSYGPEWADRSLAGLGAAQYKTLRANTGGRSARTQPL
jgi:hypothetical protein